jgi:hypothetical protein
MKALVASIFLSLLFPGCTLAVDCDIVNASGHVVTITGYRLRESRSFGPIAPGDKVRIDGMWRIIEVKADSSHRYQLKASPPPECIKLTGWWMWKHRVYQAELQRDGNIVVLCPGAGQFVVEPLNATERRDSL